MKRIRPRPVDRTVQQELESRNIVFNTTTESLWDRAREWLLRHPRLHRFYLRIAPFVRGLQKALPLRALPDFVIIGAAKTGTTSLYSLVAQHPEIVPAIKKEVNYFQLYYGFDSPWYRSHFPTKASRFFSRISGRNLLTGEATPDYLFHPLVPGGMKKILPDVKLIVILRNPVDRAHSHYQMNVKDKVEPLSFEEAIEAEEKRYAEAREQLIKNPDFVTDDARVNFLKYPYLAQGLYADHLENWFRYYDREKFLILINEDFRNNRQRSLDQVFEFLGVRPFQPEKPRDLNVGDYPAMNEDTRRRLVEYFKPHNAKLSRLLQRSFDWNR